MAESAFENRIETSITTAQIVLKHWSVELWTMLQEISPWKLVDRNRECIITFYNDCISVVALIDEKTEEIAKIPYSNSVSATDVLSVSHIINANGLRRDVTVFIPTDETLRPTIKMPAVRNSVLKRALPYEIERVTPLPLADLYYDFLIGETEKTSHTTDVTVRLVRKTYIDKVVSFCRSARLNIAELAFENDKVTANHTTFPIDKTAYFRAVWNRYRFILLAMAAVILFIMVSIAAYERDSARLKAIDDLVADAGDRAARVEYLQHKIDAATRELGSATDKKKSFLFIAGFKKLTDVIPDGAWISELEQDGNKIRIQGAAPSASILIGAIDHSGYFRNAAFEAPVVRDSSNNTERFNISFEVVGGK